MEEGDLGFGQGLKPGAISTSTEDVDLSPRQQDLKIKSESREQEPDVVRKSNGSSRRLKRSNSLGSAIKRERNGENEREEIPEFAGVPLGTSLRQQKVLYTQNITDFLKKKDKLKLAADVKGSAVPASFFAVQQSIVNRLQEASNEVIVLQSELEASKSQLDSKYRAIRILQNQFSHVAALNAEKQRNIVTVQDQAKVLQKEVNALQFELDAKSSSFMFSEQTWAERFDRLSIENTALMATLQARSDEVRRLHADKMALKRERDELLAMMDANERLQYDRHWSSKNDACLNNSVSEQMAVLGSCLCRGNKPEPCRCAKTAALLKKDNSLLKDENFKLNESLKEAYLVADAFRKAFEEQLNRNSSMSKELADSPPPSAAKDAEKNGMRRKPLLPWMKKTPPKNGHCQRDDVGKLLAESLDIQALVVSELDEIHHERSRSVGVQVSQPMPDLIRNMAELLNDKSEALAHQRLVTKMLARRTQDLEATMKKYSDL
ncbi:coiled-coil domain-containing protein 125-like isoform X1 [Lytechinus variegatus]|uniref:coiled-coil domain-containing protein 125-like isoform X1 n=1 Tax=Lytechinus variegatus TaxID=7654 RepID=UPI001BB1C09B|nr:coiled-coil domain-containing protein 125-like isoform X1 [Lytechinus variegatus]